MSEQLSFDVFSPVAPTIARLPHAIVSHVPMEPEKMFHGEHIKFGGIDLRPYQDASIEAMRKLIRMNTKNIVLCAPTGSGKTVCAAYMLYEAHRLGRRAIFVADRIALIDQTSEVLDRYGVPHGVIQGNHWRRDPQKPIQVASAQTLGKRGWPGADLIVIDECHTQIKNTIEKITERKCITIGLSATPFSEGLGKSYDAVVTVTTTNKLTEEKFLVPFRIFAASEPNMKGAKTVAGEWTDKECSQRAMPIIGDAVREYLRHADGTKFIAFGCDVNHCEALQRQFAAAGIRAELYTYRTPDTERSDMLKEFRGADSSIRGLISVAALSKGFDAPDVQTIIMCRPLRKSLTEHIQILGRGLRPFPGKEVCTVLDHSGNTLRFWEDMHDFFENGIQSLDDGTKKEKKKPEKGEKEPMKCPQCFHVHDPLPACPQCGFEYPKKKAPVHVAGDLRELGGTVKASLEDKQTFHAMLVFLRDEHNARSEKQWKPGWVAMKYKDRFGVWPRHLDEELSMEPTRSMRTWLQSQWIRYIKSQEKATA